MAGTSYVLVDFPRAATARGAGRKKMRWARRGRTWWTTRPRTSSTGTWTITGNFEWVVIRTKPIKKDRVEDADWRGRRGGRITTNKLPDLQAGDRRDGERSAVELIDEGTHGLAKLGGCRYSGCGFRKGCGC